MSTPTRADRKAQIFRYNFTDQSDALESVYQADKMILTLHPSLGSDFPTVTIEQKVKNAQTLPNRPPVEKAWRGWIEVDGVVYAVVCIEYDTMHTASYTTSDFPPTFGYAYTKDGKSLVMSIESTNNDPGVIFIALAAKIQYKSAAKKIPDSDLSFNEGEVNYDDMTQNWTATIKTGGLFYSVGGETRDLRKQGHDPKKYQHFKNAFLFAQALPNGKKFKHILTETGTGEFCAVSFNGEGQCIQDTKSKINLDAALIAAVDVSRNYC